MEASSWFAKVGWLLNALVTLGLAVWSITAATILERDFVHHVPRLLQEWRGKTIAGTDGDIGTGGLLSHMGDRDLLAATHALAGLLGISAAFGICTTLILAYTIAKGFKDLSARAYNLEDGDDDTRGLVVLIALRNLFWTFAFLASLFTWIPVTILREALLGIQSASDGNITGTLPVSSLAWNDDWWAVFLLIIGVVSSVNALCTLILGAFAHIGIHTGEKSVQ